MQIASPVVQDMCRLEPSIWIHTSVGLVFNAQIAEILTSQSSRSLALGVLLVCIVLFPLQPFKGQ